MIFKESFKIWPKICKICFHTWTKTNFREQLTLLKDTELGNQSSVKVLAARLGVKDQGIASRNKQ
jgi:hypothetical protein